MTQDNMLDKNNTDDELVTYDDLPNAPEPHDVGLDEKEAPSVTLENLFDAFLNQQIMVANFLVFRHQMISYLSYASGQYSGKLSEIQPVAKSEQVEFNGHDRGLTFNNCLLLAEFKGIFATYKALGVDVDTIFTKYYLDYCNSIDSKKAT